MVPDLFTSYTVADPDLELKRGVGGWGDSFTCPVSFSPSDVSSFLPKIAGGGGGGVRPLGPPLNLPLLHASNIKKNPNETRQCESLRVQTLDQRPKPSVHDK